MFTFDITQLPLLVLCGLLATYTAVATRIYFKTNIRGDLYISLIGAFLTLLSLKQFDYTGEVLFWSTSFHLATLSLLVVTAANKLFSEKKSAAIVSPFILGAILTFAALFTDEVLAGFIVMFAHLLIAIGLFFIRNTDGSYDVLRVIFYVLLAFLIGSGVLFLGRPAVMLYSLLIVIIMLYELVRYFDRVLSLMTNAGISSLTDPLTGLFNKGFLVKKSIQVVEKQEMCIIFCDIDNFKILNDTRGHDYGDEVLIKAGHIAKELAQTNAYTTRYGGEEIVLISLLPLRESVALANNILSKLSQDINITMSIGVASSHELEAKDPESLAKKTITLADKRMYIAKKSGKNRVVYKGDEF